MLPPPLQAVLTPQAMRLHAIVDVEVAARAGWTPLHLASAYLRGGARLIQVRAKSLPGSAFLDLATRIHEAASAAGALVVVNDRADIARLAGAEGVHLGQDDLPPAAARVLVGHAIVGLSTHSVEQVQGAVTHPITYLAIGPVFGTSTKETGYAAIGLDGVRRAVEAARPHGLPVIAIGGITLERVRDVVDAGAAGVAVISDLLEGDEPEARTRAYLERLDRAGKV